jgi:hypothetical protein
MKLILIFIAVVTCAGNFLGQWSIEFPLHDYFNFVNTKAFESA